MTKRIKSLSVLAVAVLAGLFVSLSTTEIKANETIANSNDESVLFAGNIAINAIAVSTYGDYDKCGEGKCGESKTGESKCGEGKCGTAAKGAKKEGAAKTEKSGAKVATPAMKCGEGKCGAAMKKESKTEKKESKTEKKAESKCGQGKCGAA